MRQKQTPSTRIQEEIKLFNIADIIYIYCCRLAKAFGNKTMCQQTGKHNQSVIFCRCQPHLALKTKPKIKL